MRRRRGVGLNLLPETLWIDVKTVRLIAAMYRSTVKKHDGSAKKLFQAVI